MGLIDAKGLVVGRLATWSRCALRGKHLPTYTPHVDCGDNVIIINAAHVVLTGRKRETRSITSTPASSAASRNAPQKSILEGRFPERVVEKAIERMIPAGRLAVCRWAICASIPAPSIRMKPRIPRRSISLR
jgi:ribosomal protein L13, bacterial type